MGIHEKIEELKTYLSSFDHLAIAFSGGVDSTFLLLVAHEVLGNDVVAITMTGPNFAPDEMTEAKDICKRYEIPHIIMAMPDHVLKAIEDNPPDRCYICKRGLFSFLLHVIDGDPLADGTNLDDVMCDHRPGIRALKELHILSPLKEIGFTKQDVRDALRAMNIDIWDKPAYACLATRIPFGEKLTPEKMDAVFKVEHFIRELGFAQVRVRHHGDIAIVEVPPCDRERFAKQNILDAVDGKIKECGFKFATMDLAGYTMGKLNGTEK